jgi:hypothetical protein
MHITDSAKCNWLRARIETADPPSYSQQKKLNILDRLTWSEQFESFLANKYTAAKRFGLEGCESLIPGMKALIDTAAEMGVNSIVLGMPHRGTPASNRATAPPCCPRCRPRCCSRWRGAAACAAVRTRRSLGTAAPGARSSPGAPFLACLLPCFFPATRLHPLTHAQAG